jgi:hypothetical protein
MKLKELYIERLGPNKLRKTTVKGSSFRTPHYRVLWEEGDEISTNYFPSKFLGARFILCYNKLSAITK